MANDPLSRAAGLLFTRSFPLSRGLLLTETNLITMLGMRFAIDVAFLDRSLRVAELAPSLRPWRIARWSRAASATLELPVGALSASRTQVGDELLIEEIP